MKVKTKKNNIRKRRQTIRGGRRGNNKLGSAIRNLLRI